MGVSTLHASNIKGKMFQFACASRVLCGLGPKSVNFMTAVTAVNFCACQTTSHRVTEGSTISTICFVGSVDEAHCCDTSRFLRDFVGPHSRGTSGKHGCNPALVHETLYKMDVLQYSHQIETDCLTHNLQTAVLSIRSTHTLDLTDREAPQRETRHCITTEVPTRFVSLLDRDLPELLLEKRVLSLLRL